MYILVYNVFIVNNKNSQKNRPISPWPIPTTISKLEDYDLPTFKKHVKVHGTLPCTRIYIFSLVMVIISWLRFEQQNLPNK